MISALATRFQKWREKELISSIPDQVKFSGSLCLRPELNLSALTTSHVLSNRLAGSILSCKPVGEIYTSQRQLQIVHGFPQCSSMHEGYARNITIFTSIPLIPWIVCTGRWNGDIEDNPDIDSMQRQSAMGTQKLLQHLIFNVRYSCGINRSAQGEILINPVRFPRLPGKSSQTVN